jgi:hypothetical protein
MVLDHTKKHILILRHFYYVLILNWLRFPMHNYVHKFSNTRMDVISPLPQKKSDFISNNYYCDNYYFCNNSVGYLNKRYPNSTTKNDKPPEKITPRLYPRRYNEPKPRMGCLDHVLTRTRLARRDASTIGKSPTRTTLGRAGRPASPTYF